MMKDDELLRRDVHQAADTCLSGVEALPSLHGDIMDRIQGKKGGKKKISFALVCAIIMVLALGGVAMAAGLASIGYFSELLKQEQPLDAERLSRVDSLTVEQNVTVHLTTPEAQSNGDGLRGQLIEAMGGREFDLTVEDVYCNGNKLYFTYVFKHDENQAFFGEGNPGGIDEWTWKYLEDEWEDVASLGNPSYWDAENAWFAEHPKDSYFASLQCSVGDGAELADGSALCIWDGWVERVDENTIRGFYEVELPEGYETGESVDIVLKVMYNAVVNYIGEDGIYWAHIAPEENRGIMSVPLTVPVTGDVTPASGTMETDEYGAQAKLLVSDFDIAGTVIVQAAEGWDTGDAMSGSFVRDYILVAGSQELSDVSGGLGPIGEDGTYVIQVRFNLPDSLEGLALRPMRREKGIVDDRSEDIPISIAQ